MIMFKLQYSNFMLKMGNLLLCREKINILTIIAFNLKKMLLQQPNSKNWFYLK